MLLPGRPHNAAAADSCYCQVSSSQAQLDEVLRVVDLAGGWGGPGGRSALTGSSMCVNWAMWVLGVNSALRGSLPLCGGHLGGCICVA